MINTFLVCFALLMSVIGMGGAAVYEFLRGTRNAAFWWAVAMVVSIIVTSVVAAFL